jgi:predicted transcriptional regulator
MAGERKRDQRPQRRESRWRTARVTIRLHVDLKEAIELLAEQDNRTTANWIETEVIAAVRRRVENEFAATGQRLDHGPLKPRK